ncbi:hypothetical protein [Pantoea coffeiphila]|uniref:hypothetical protein n=1 Tax=Pantoea coffeiphila TaxID=1465635 RepID=UPI0019600468|nr:hypothetical protein [Pantoea coffeiphila]MBM7343275.1 hypothetical protein [Pantoea coffeiphila]
MFEVLFTFFLSASFVKIAIPVGLIFLTPMPDIRKTRLIEESYLWQRVSLYGRDNRSYEVQAAGPEIPISPFQEAMILLQGVQPLRLPGNPQR